MREWLEAVGIALFVAAGLMSLAFALVAFIATGVSVAIAALFVLAPILSFALLLEYRKQARADAAKREDAADREETEP